jgi:hypothetical protein
MYSDTYQPGAERLSITAGGPRQDQSAADDAPADQQTGANDLEYQSFQIVKPLDDATINDPDGSVIVKLSISPSLASGHMIHIMLDGERLASELTTTQFSLNALPGGTHSLQANVVDAAGNPQISTSTINFHLHEPASSNP